MNFFVVVALLALVAIGGALIFLYRALSSRQISEISPDGGLVLSPEKYRPMERLLLEDDFQFLSAQAGYSPRLGRRFRAERRRVFRGYLRALRKDFDRLSLAFQTLILHSAEDRGDLAAALVRQRLLFAAGMLAIEMRLLLHAAGMTTIKVDVHGLLESMATIQAQMTQLLTPQAGAAVA